VPEPTIHYFRVTTQVIAIEPAGKRKSPVVYDLWLEYAPKPGGSEDVVTCRRSIQAADHEILAASDREIS
jgi:hypothetical protein